MTAGCDQPVDFPPGVAFAHMPQSPGVQGTDVTLWRQKAYKAHGQSLFLLGYCFNTY